MARDSTSCNQITSSLIHYCSKASASFSPQQNNGRIGELLALFWIQPYDHIFYLEPLAPLFFSTVAIIGRFFGIILIVALDFAILFTDSLIFFATSINREKVVDEQVLRFT